MLLIKPSTMHGRRDHEERGCSVWSFSPSEARERGVGRWDGCRVDYILAGGTLDLDLKGPGSPHRHAAPEPSAPLDRSTDGAAGQAQGSEGFRLGHQGNGAAAAPAAADDAAGAHEGGAGEGPSMQSQVRDGTDACAASVLPCSGAAKQPGAAQDAAASSSGAKVRPHNKLVMCHAAQDESY